MITIVVFCGKGFNLPPSEVIPIVGPIYNMDEVFAKPLLKSYRYYFFESIVARFLKRP